MRKGKQQMSSSTQAITETACRASGSGYVHIRKGKGLLSGLLSSRVGRARDDKASAVPCRAIKARG